MASRHSPSAEQPARDLKGFWQAAFLSAAIPLLRNKGKTAPGGLAHLAAEYADAALNEFRRRYP